MSPEPPRDQVLHDPIQRRTDASQLPTPTPIPSTIARKRLLPLAYAPAPARAASGNAVSIAACIQSGASQSAAIRTPTKVAANEAAAASEEVSGGRRCIAQMVGREQGA